jgi:hypothetical protein
MSHISNARMVAFQNQIVKQVRELLFEREEDILKAWQKSIEEAQNNDDKFPPLKLSIGATVDLEAGKIETALAFSTRYKSTISSNLPDPNQPEIPGLEEGGDE